MGFSNKTIKFGGGFSKDLHDRFMKSLSGEIGYIKQKDYIVIFSSNGIALSIDFDVYDYIRVNNMFSYKLDTKEKEYTTLEKKAVLKLLLMDNISQIKFFIENFKLDNSDFTFAI